MKLLQPIVIGLALLSLLGSSLRAQTENLSLAISPTRMHIDGDRVLFGAIESSQGVDLNGDGDTIDLVYHVYDSSSGELTNLGLAGFNLSTSVKVDQIREGVVAVLVSESAQGATDLNGDGDALDQVAHIHETSTGATTNLGVAALHIRVSGSAVLVPVREADQNAADLNGDGDAVDTVAHVYDVAAGSLTNTGLAIAQLGENRLLDGPLVVIEADEESQGGTDLNGDGDATDDVLHVHDVSTGATVNVGLVSTGNPWIAQGRVFFQVYELDQGGVDRNGDGDPSDTVLHVHDVESGVTTNVGIWASGLSVADDRIAFSVSESGQGNTDLNSDGDTFDGVVHLYDAATGILVNVGLSSSNNNLSGSLLGMLVREFSQGNTDLNGDGDSIDQVVHLYDADSMTPTNLGLDSDSSDRGPIISGAFVAFTASESGSGGIDLNGDGDSTDERVVHVYDSVRGTLRNLGLASNDDQTYDPRIRDDLVVFRVDEADQGGTDLNGDGDALDVVVHLYHTGAHHALNLGLAGIPEDRPIPDTGNDFALFAVKESAQGNTDLNGDGDSGDVILYVTRQDVALCGVGAVTVACFEGDPIDEGIGRVEDVLFVNGSAGDAERTITVTPQTPLSFTILEPSSRHGDGQPSAACIYAWLGLPGPHDFVTVPKALGTMCYGPFILATKNPKKTWNGIGFVSQLGVDNGPGDPPIIPDESCFEFLSLPGGLGLSVTVTLQGIIEDSCSLGNLPYSITNGLAVKIQ